MCFTQCYSIDVPSSITQRRHVPLLQSHMEEDSRVWPSEKLQRPTRCQRTCSSCCSSTTPTTRQSWKLLATHTRQGRLYQTHHRPGKKADSYHQHGTITRPRDPEPTTIERADTTNLREWRRHIPTSTRSSTNQERACSKWSQDGRVLGRR